jgi:glycolate oxidase iron-sulfur subunit
MQTEIHESLRLHPDASEAQSILRACVHCGFCNATCPTYLELADERDGPRGRIYLIKQLLEKGTASASTQMHLDRCLTCRNCETTCPSGVRYGRLVDIGRGLLEPIVPRSLRERVLRRLLQTIVPYAGRFRVALAAARAVAIFLPRKLRTKIPARQRIGAAPRHTRDRQMLILAGCAQAAATPNTNRAAARVFDRLGISFVSPAHAGCCGALSYHLGEHEAAKAFMRRNIDAWWPKLEGGAEAIVVAASGCSATIKEYGTILRDDANYAAKARRVAEATLDLSEALARENLATLGPSESGRGAATNKVALHCPCTLQHAQRRGGHLESLLQGLGVNLVRTKDPHLCCGSAGTYSILQPQLSTKLRDNKLTALTAHGPDLIVTANVGCQLHLATAAGVPVKHWIELVDEAAHSRSK